MSGCPRRSTAGCCVRHGWIARWELRDVLSCAPPNGLETRTVDLGHDQDGTPVPNAIIPSVAIHMNRAANDNASL